MQLPLPLFPTDPAVLEALVSVVESEPEAWRYQLYNKSLLNFTPLGAGASRTVFDLGNGLVCKVQRIVNDGWGTQSKEEWEYWKKATPEQKELLCPIVAHDEINHRWTIMPKADAYEYDGEFDDDDDTEVRDEYSFGTKWREVNGRPCYDIGPQNLGWYEGRLVMVDYGVNS